MEVGRITLDPEICHGKPCVRGMRWPVEVILDMLSSGMSPEDIVKDHPELEKDDIIACLSYAGSVVSNSRMIPAAS
ncbi:MAG: DUF433 domain-containing protein [Spirochaetota bacterium]